MAFKQPAVGVRQETTENARGRKTFRVTKAKPRRPLRRSARLEEKKKLESGETDEEREILHPRSDIIPKRPTQKTSHLKRKRLQDSEAQPSPSPAEERCKRSRTSGVSPYAKEYSNQSAVDSNSYEDTNPIGYWSQHKRWPKEYFEEGSNMDSLLARKRSGNSLSRKNSDAGSVASSSHTPSDEQQREVKSAAYKDSRYETLLATKRSFMKPSTLGITLSDKSLCSTLLEQEQQYPRDSLFRDEIFGSTCETIRNRNETRVIRDIALLIVPSAEILTIHGATNLQCLIESVNEGWNDSIPISKTRPQPDYAVGFRREAFTEDRLTRLRPFVGDVTDSRNESYFMATYYMYFPFLTCEVKCGAAALDIADRQNAHSMTIAVRAVVELFRYVKREKELDREILAFSISHDHETVRIYGHYAEIDGPEPKYYRHPIRKFNFTEVEGREKWTAYKFTKNVYDTWMPRHFQRICSAIDAFPPGVDFDLSQQSELQFTESFVLSEELQASSLAQSSASSQHSQSEVNTLSSRAGTPNITPNTSVNESGPFKRPRKERGRGER